jgi:3'(2'), 5'-bisphosphate nucleotidase
LPRIACGKNDIVMDSSHPPTDRLSLHCVELALAAGREIMDVYASGPLTAAVKSDASPVTVADTRAEAVILRGLREAYPEIAVVAEEQVAAGLVPPAARRFFLVDPLDGTKEFLNRNGEFTVNIALVDDGVPRVGVVYAPALGEIFVGNRDGAFRARIAGRMCEGWSRITARRVTGPVVAVGSRSHGTGAAADWLRRHRIEHFHPRGSSLKFCLVAAGEADIYPRFGRTMEWDTAAGDAILRAAGGMVAGLDGRPLIYNKRGRDQEPDFANADFVACGDPDLVKSISSNAAAG